MVKHASYLKQNRMKGFNWWINEGDYFSLLNPDNVNADILNSLNNISNSLNVFHLYVYTSNRYVIYLMNSTFVK